MADLFRWCSFVLALVAVGFVAGRLQVLDARSFVIDDGVAAVRRDADVEYSARQCMVTVARGDYDAFLGQLGWRRDGGAR